MMRKLLIGCYHSFVQEQFKKPAHQIIWFQVLLCVLIGFLACTSSSAAEDQFNWKYKKVVNHFDDKISTAAWASTTNYQYNNNFSVAFRCFEGRPNFEVDVDTFITAKGDLFKFQYRVDTKKTKTIKMKTFSYSNNGGNTYEHAKKMAKDIIGGKKMRVRVVGWSNSFFDSEISLIGADSLIKKVFKDCLVDIYEPKDKKTKSGYSLRDFLDDFRKLTPKLQKIILKDIKRLMS